MQSDRILVANAFEKWMAGTGSIAGILAPDLEWEVAGQFLRYHGARSFIDGVLTPGGTRYRPIRIHGIFHDGVAETVVVLWEGAVTTYAWVLRLQQGKVVSGTEVRAR